MMSQFAEYNNMEWIDPYDIFLSGGAGVGKSSVKIYNWLSQKKHEILWSKPWSASGTCESIWKTVTW